MAKAKNISSFLTEEQLKKLAEIVAKDPERYYNQSRLFLELESAINPEQAKLLNVIQSTAKAYLPKGYESKKASEVFEKYPQIKEAVEKDPKKAFKILYQMYNTRKFDKEAPYLVPLMDYTKAKLLQKNIDPTDVIEKKGTVKKTWEFIGNVLQLPANLLAGATQKTLKLTSGKKPVAPVKLWGGSWSDVIHSEYIKKHPELLDIIRKVAMNEQLTNKELEKYKKMQKTTMWGGLAGDVILDPSNLVGGVATKLNKFKKALKTVKTGTELSTKANKLVSIANASIDIAKGMKKVGAAKKILRSSERILDILGDTSKLDKSAKAVNKIAKATQEVENIKQALKTVDNIKEAKRLLKNITKAQKRLYEFDKAIKAVKTSKTARKAGEFAEVVEKGSKVVSKPAITGSKYLKGKLAGLRRLFISDFARPLENIKEQAKIVENVYKSITNKAQQDIHAMLKAVAKKHKMKVDDISKIATDFIEKGEKANIPKLIAEDLKPLKDYYSDFNRHLIIQEAIANANYTPIGMSEKKISEFRKIIKPLKGFDRLNNENRLLFEKAYKKAFDWLKDNYTPKLGSDLLVETSKADNIATAVEEYLHHTITDDFRKYLEAIDKSPTKQKATKSIKFGFQKLRKLDAPVSEINKLAEQGKLFEGFKGKVFEEDLRKLTLARVAKGTKSVFYNKFIDSLREMVKKNEGKLFLKKYKKGYVNIAKYLKLDEPVFAPEDIAKTLEILNNPVRFKGVLKQVFKLYDTTLSFIKGMLTVGSLPKGVSFFTRNMVGNIFNSLLSDVSTASLTKGWALALRLMKNSEAVKSFVTKNGKVYTIKKVAQLLREHGILEGEFATEILQDIETSGKALKRVGGKILLAPQKAGAKLNELIESHAKIGLFIGALIDGKPPVEAAREVKKILFDYSDLTTFEKQVMKRIVPFWTWMRKNIGLQLEKMLTKPYSRGYRIITKAERDIKSQKETIINPNYKTGFLANKNALVLWKDPVNRKALLFMLDGFTPNYDLNEIIRILKNPQQFASENINPVLNMLLGAIFDWDVEKKRPFTELHGKKVGLPEALFNRLIKLSPFYRLWSNNIFGLRGNAKRLDIFNRINTLPEKSRLQKVMSLLIGTPLDYDERYARIIKNRNEKQELFRQISLALALLKKFRAKYAGNKYPKKDMKEIAQTILNIYNAIQGGMKAGYITARDKRLISYFKRLLIDFAKTDAGYKLRAGLLKPGDLKGTK